LTATAAAVAGVATGAKLIVFVFEPLALTDFVVTVELLLIVSVLVSAVALLEDVKVVVFELLGTTVLAADTLVVIVLGDGLIRIVPDATIEAEAEVEAGPGVG